ncbi:MAG TPA: TIGR03905 family TSCPD domain-containing protein [Candidatus Fimenecus excrementigallinarum]|uniref:ribonucleoside-diphosphate reductase n=1 Tax=Candidatus Fimenecus excrementigallinarum TaxID=2840816 RepID=A0A9D1LC64_9FIRM|nr:TIGR03905 family TSCPD domain-containing protein [Candidatus Fimenecus excrementigallinarum]
MTYTYRTRGTCSQQIEVELDGDVIKKVRFYGGCNGNTQGVARLAEGRRVEDVVETLSGIRCGLRPTSCPDQLARALREAQKAQREAE